MDNAPKAGTPCIDRDRCLLCNREQLRESKNTLQSSSLVLFMTFIYLSLPKLAAFCISFDLIGSGKGQHSLIWSARVVLVSIG